MAEKISINIDLSSSKWIESHDDEVAHEKPLQQNKKNSVEYKYRYDRIFVLIVFAVIILFSIYLLFSDNNDVIVPLTTEREPVKQRHLSVPVNDTIKSQNQAVYLFYETINVLETFYLPFEEQGNKQ